MSPQVLSILNNAKIFLSDDELRDLACAIDRDLGKAQPKKTKKPSILEEWTVEKLTVSLLANEFRPRKRTIPTSK